jgi:hypothetical protein
VIEKHWSERVAHLYPGSIQHEYDISLGNLWWGWHSVIADKFINIHVSGQREALVDGIQLCGQDVRWSSNEAYKIVTEDVSNNNAKSRSNGRACELVASSLSQSYTSRLKKKSRLLKPMWLQRLWENSESLM